jgi:hypothetical protein
MLLRCFATNIARAVPAKTMNNRGRSGRVELLLELSLTVLVGAGVTRGVAVAVGEALGEALAAALGEALAAALGEALAAALAEALAAALAAALAEALAAALAEALAAALAEALAAAPGATGAIEHAVVIVSPIKVTSPVWASARPCTVAPSSIVMDVEAMIVPMKVEPELRVAELWTCQKTLHELAPLVSTTELDDAVMRSDVAWKIQTALGSFWASSVSVPGIRSVAPPAL